MVRTWLFNVGSRILSLVRELRSCMPSGIAGLGGRDGGKMLKE